MTDFLMPRLGADMEAGTLVAWKKRPGEAVHRGDIVAEVETDKGVIDVEIFSAGKLDKLLVAPGTRVPVGTPLATILEDGAVPTKNPPSSQVVESRHVPLATAELPTPVAATVSPLPTIDLTRLRISPSARRLARELGVDPNTLTGTGHGGAITREDIERAAHVRDATAQSPTLSSPPAALAAAPPSASSSVVAAADRFARMRQTIAAAMTRSKREIPHYYLSTTIDMRRAMEWLEKTNSERPVTDRLLYGVLLVKAAAVALREVPELNATWENGAAKKQSQINVGVAIALRQGGLIAPAIHDTDQQSLEQLMKHFRDLINRARAGGLRSSELSDPTITVTSLGEKGVESVFGVIYPPQVAIVGFGKVVERPWVADGQIVIRPIVTATLSADHRVTDGHRGALFLAAIDRILQEPEKL